MIEGVIYSCESPCKKKYYGYTINFNKRKKQHINEAIKGTYTKFYNALRKYGADNFEWKIIEIYQKNNKSELNKILKEREVFWIKKDNTYKKGYNSTKGGDGTIGFKLKKETKKKISKSLTGFKFDEKTKQKLSQLRKGKKFTEEHKQNLSKSLKKVDYSFRIGRKHSEETKQKIRESNRGKKFTEEHKRKLSLSHKI